MVADKVQKENQRGKAERDLEGKKVTVGSVPSYVTARGSKIGFCFFPSGEYFKSEKFKNPINYDIQKHKIVRNNFHKSALP